jgi:hypothetical protein
VQSSRPVVSCPQIPLPTGTTHASPHVSIGRPRQHMPAANHECLDAERGSAPQSAARFRARRHSHSAGGMPSQATGRSPAGPLQHDVGPQSGSDRVARWTEAAQRVPETERQRLDRGCAARAGGRQWRPLLTHHRQVGPLLYAGSHGAVPDAQSLCRLRCSDPFPARYLRPLCGPLKAGSIRVHHPQNQGSFTAAHKLIAQS